MMMQRVGLAQALTVDASPAFLGDYLIEATLLPDNFGTPKMVFDYQPSPGIGASIVDFTPSTIAQHIAACAPVNIVPATCRFTYAWQGGRGISYLIGNDSAGGTGNSFLWASGDPSMTSPWSKANGGYAVASAFPTLFNIAACPERDNLHALIELPDGLYYAKTCAPELGTINFDGAVKVIPGGGNADMKLSPCGCYLVALIGMRDTRFGNLVWYTTAAVGDLSLDLTQEANWRIAMDAFILGQSGYAICDPSWLDDGAGGMVGMVSYNQACSVRFRAPMSIAAFCRYLIG